MKSFARVVFCLLLAGCASSPFARPSSHVKTEIRPGSNIARVAVAIEGMPLPGIEVRFQQGHKTRVKVTPASGEVAVQLGPGTWQVVTHFEGFASARGNVTLSTSEDAEMLIDLVPDPRLQFVADLDPPPSLPGACSFAMRLPGIEVLPIH